MNPLRKLHEQAEAEFQAYGEMEIVSTFGEPQAEYAAVRKGCALFDVAQRGVIEATGPDRIGFLNRMLTNQLLQKDGKTALLGGAGVYAYLLNNKGRIVADMNILERGDRTLLETDARNISAVLENLRKYAISDKVEFGSLVDRVHQIALVGPGSRDVLQKVFGDAPALEILESARANLEGMETVIWRDDPCGVAGYFVMVACEWAAKLWMRIVSAFPAGEPGKRAVRLAGWAVFNTARIEAGRPLFGIDFDDAMLPAETGQLDRAVSFTKGCYLGQEIVARMHSRGQAARQMVGIRMVDGALPIAGAPIVDDKQNQIGGITSSTISPVLSNAAICLGLIKSQFAGVGREIQVAAEGAFRKGVVSQLPFLNGVSG